ncbi:zinc finger protein 595-like [Acyrthosiphon pisum]|uniref:Uncharacterized protein n=1 Tax=Acyrthosiphon pisum TaxID=7029 RepID=A0A8R2F788_ACYPI|nr:zinc finger protein 595-like [Acyrthosiphon pisum]|eukprot:XP_008180857.1 PREDICTED: zinc finger protein 595-like [Acyrthosiphon pisum]
MNQRALGMEENARMLCVMDDMCLTNDVDPKLGFKTHKTGLGPEAIVSPKYKKTFLSLKEAYSKAMGKDSRIALEICNRYPNDDGCGVKITARKVIWKNQIINELYGRMAPVNEDFFGKHGVKDFSVVISNTKNDIKLLLGPVSFVNHDCESNTDLFTLGPKSTTIRANRKISIGEEITTYYGSSYFGYNNSECMCISCEKKKDGHFKQQCPVQSDTDSNVEERDNLLTCAICCSCFLYKSWLKRHITSHMDPSVSCDRCNKVFKRGDSLKRHIKSMHEAVSYTCKTCSKSFNTTSNLKRHENTQHGSKTKLTCEKCGKTFSNKQNLSYHGNIKHTGVKPYKCDTCNEQFGSPCYLKRHVNKEH